MSLPTLDDSTLDDLHKWLETIPFSRPRKHLARDFSDGREIKMLFRFNFQNLDSFSNFKLIVLVAELISHFLPGFVQLHNYVSANSTVYKRYNWDTLSKSVTLSCARASY